MVKEIKAEKYNRHNPCIYAITDPEMLYWWNVSTQKHRSLFTFQTSRYCREYISYAYNYFGWKETDL